MRQGPRAARLGRAQSRAGICAHG